MNVDIIWKYKFSKYKVSNIWLPILHPYNNNGRLVPCFLSEIKLGLSKDAMYFEFVY